jgi:hypothetical protein
VAAAAGASVAAAGAAVGATAGAPAPQALITIALTSMSAPNNHERELRMVKTLLVDSLHGT